MPSFDAVSELDRHELSNAIDQANREVGTRFDFKGSGASFELKERTVTLITESDFQLKQMQDILAAKLTKRGIDLGFLAYDEAEIHHRRATQTATVKEGIEKEDAKKLVKIIKESKIKVQAAIQGEQLRITGKKRDDLQQVMALLKEQSALPLNFTNFRD